MLALAYLVPVWFLTRESFGVAVLLPLVTLPYALSVTRTVFTETSGRALNPALERVGKLLAMFAALFGFGLSFGGLPL
jgi:1,4-dihydroxy-2-naphthoate octaprenyltransferase